MPYTSHVIAVFLPSLCSAHGQLVRPRLVPAPPWPGAARAAREGAAGGPQGGGRSVPRVPAMAGAPRPPVRLQPRVEPVGAGAYRSPAPPRRDRDELHLDSQPRRDGCPANASPECHASFNLGISVRSSA